MKMFWKKKKVEPKGMVNLLIGRFSKESIKNNKGVLKREYKRLLDQEAENVQILFSEMVNKSSIPAKVIMKNFRVGKLERLVLAISDYRTVEREKQNIIGYN